MGGLLKGTMFFLGVFVFYHNRQCFLLDIAKNLYIFKGSYSRQKGFKKKDLGLGVSIIEDDKSVEKDLSIGFRFYLSKIFSKLKSEDERMIQIALDTVSKDIEICSILLKLRVLEGLESVVLNDTQISKLQLRAKPELTVDGVVK